MLDLFEHYNIAATWATVGFLFARSRAEFREFMLRCVQNMKNPPFIRTRSRWGRGSRTIRFILRHL